jgi:1,4-dihydroxy-2-naphthoyl-CoA synthase
MNKLVIVANEKGQLIYYTSLKEALCADKTLLMVYLEGKFSLKQILSLLSIPLIYAEIESIFDFSDAKDLFEEALPSNFALLVKRIGYASTLEVLLGNNVYKTKDLYRLGLINQIYTKEEFEQQVKRVSNLSLSAIDLALDLVKHMPHLANAQAEVLERYAFALRFAHPNQKEGMQAFLEKRPPKFS